MNFLEDFYYGNIDPQARGVRRNSKLDKVVALLVKCEELLSEKLTREEKQLFLAYVSAYCELLSTCENNAFISGFRLGAQFAYDAFLEDDGQTYDLLKNNIE